MYGKASSGRWAASTAGRVLSPPETEPLTLALQGHRECEGGRY